MARRPDDTSGALIFQEGKNIEGEFYIIAVYDDPASCTISFSAYELENDCTYTYPMSYSEFDGLFKFDSELMNPSNVDGRFHWVIERLDFVQDSPTLSLGRATALVLEAAFPGPCLAQPSAGRRGSLRCGAIASGPFPNIPTGVHCAVLGGHSHC